MGFVIGLRSILVIGLWHIHIYGSQQHCFGSFGEFNSSPHVLTEVLFVQLSRSDCSLIDLKLKKDCPKKTEGLSVTNQPTHLFQRGVVISERGCNANDNWAWSVLTFRVMNMITLLTKNFYLWGIGFLPK
jgi:hypothetical protein